MTKSGKHCGKRWNCTFCAISSFVTMFSKSRLLQRCQKASIWGKGLKHCVQDDQQSLNIKKILKWQPSNMLAQCQIKLNSQNCSWSAKWPTAKFVQINVILNKTAARAQNLKWLNYSSNVNKSSYKCSFNSGSLDHNPFPDIGTFWRLWSRRLLKSWWHMEKLLIIISTLFCKHTIIYRNCLYFGLDYSKAVCYTFIVCWYGFIIQNHTVLLYKLDTRAQKRKSCKQITSQIYQTLNFKVNITKIPKWSSTKFVPFCCLRCPPELSAYSCKTRPLDIQWIREGLR